MPNWVGALITVGMALIGAIIIHAFYFGRLLGQLLSSVKHIELSLAKNDQEHTYIWDRINDLSDRQVKLGG